MFARELPPTAGMPLEWSDFFASFSLDRFALDLAAFLQVEEVQLEASGSAAMVVAFEALKRMNKRRTVILSGYTCPLVAIAAHQAGLKVRVCDTAKDSFEFDLAKLADLCDSDTLCIVATHLAGLPVEMEPLLKLSRDCGAYLIEDAAQSLGATTVEGKVGTVGDIGIFSLACGKGFSLYDGGLLVTNNAALRASLKRVSAEIVRRRPLINFQRSLMMLGYAAFYNPTGLNFVYGNDLRSQLAKGDLIAAVGDHFEFEIPLYRFHDLRLAVGAAALRRLPEFLRDNRARGLRRQLLLKERLGINVLTERSGVQGSWPFLMLLFDSETQRDAVLANLWTSGLGVTRLFIHALSDYGYLREIVGTPDLPNARDFAARSMTITNSFWLCDRDFEQVLDIVSRELILSAEALEPIVKTF